MTSPPLEAHARRVLLVDDDDRLRSAVRRSLASPGRHIAEAASVSAALALLPSGFDLVVLDIRLPDGSGLQVAEAAAGQHPAPLLVVVSGEATGQEAFRLAQLGAVRFLSKPVSMQELQQTIDFVQEARVRLAPMVKPLVGRKDLRDVQDEIRHAMVQQALAMASGNRTAAAQLLRVSRQAIQKYLRTGRAPKSDAPPQPKLR